ncbi:MAG TPA: PEPxxWA-CTERM sorting domain-containing protein [Phenylobacterium sp.]|nr:PEPxxWA-CTERM sorting domain-containing protein [Phenylobacterium sp.]
MSLRLTLAAGAAAIATLAAAAGAQAATLYSLPGATPEMATETSVPATFLSAGGAGNLSFVIDGYASLDGQNFYEDDFTLSLNGAPIVSATFNLGGGGPDVVYFAPGGATFDNVSGNLTNVTWAGGQVFVDTPLALTAGSNTLTFAYHSLTDGHAGFQGTGDEGWGLENIQVSGAAGGVPEPAAWGLMLVGFGGMGALLRRQRRLQPAFARI